MECYSVPSNSPRLSGKDLLSPKHQYLLTVVFRYYENSTENTFNFHQTDGCLTGLGIGILSTAAVSLSPTLADIPLAGAEVIRLAFRLGILVDEVSRNLQSRPLDGGHGDSWAYVVHDAVVEEVQKELNAIHAAEVIY
jgi:hypothetical protein